MLINPKAAINNNELRKFILSKGVILVSGFWGL
jgi:hypothetical protein